MTIAGRLAEQAFRYLGIGLGVAVIEFLAIVFSQGLGIDAQEPGNLGFRKAPEPASSSTCRRRCGSGW